MSTSIFVGKLLKASFIVLIVIASAAGMSDDNFTPETASVETLDDHTGKGWFWVSGTRSPNFPDGRAFLVDSDGESLGQLSTGHWYNQLNAADKRGELISTETYFSRGSRGKRTDVVVAYDPTTLSPIWEVEIPPKRANMLKSTGTTVLTDDQRFLLVLNYTPAQSVSVVDLDKRKFVTEIQTPGCSAVYPAGNRTLYAICGNGGFLRLELDDDGNLANLSRTPKIFEPVKDFLSVAASRNGDIWYFVSLQNNVYGIRMTSEKIELVSKWPLVSDAERAENWRISGQHHTAIHKDSGKLYVIMHQGDLHTFEEPGTHVWVFDANSGKKERSIEMLGLSLSIAVSQDMKPRLYSLDFRVPFPLEHLGAALEQEGEMALMDLLQQAANIYDASSGKHMGRSRSFPHGYLNSIYVWD